MTWLLDGKFDRDEIKTRFKLEPVDPLAFMSNYTYRKKELEERVYADVIPVKYIKAAIMLIKPYKHKSGSTEYADPNLWPQSVTYIYFNPKTKEIEELG